MERRTGTTAYNLLMHGYANIEADNSYYWSTREVFEKTPAFFPKDITLKSGASYPEILEGFRKFLGEYSVAAIALDICETFSIWKRNQGFRRIGEWARENTLNQALMSVIEAYINLTNSLFNTHRVYKIRMILNL